VFRRRREQRLHSEIPPTSRYLWRRPSRRSVVKGTAPRSGGVSLATTTSAWGGARRLCPSASRGPESDDEPVSGFKARRRTIPCCSVIGVSRVSMNADFGQSRPRCAIITAQ
jgi:hypothetical protein